MKKLAKSESGKLPPPMKYLRRKIPVVSFNIRIDKVLKGRVDKASRQLDTSANKFAEAALSWYLDQMGQK